MKMIDPLEVGVYRLVPIEDRHMSDVIELRGDPQVNRYIKRPSYKSQEEKEGVFLRLFEGNQTGKHYFWVIEGEGKMVHGTICLWNLDETRNCAEVGYELFPSSQRKGIMTQALRAVIDYGFNRLKLEQIEAFTHRENMSSRRLLDRFGFQQLPWRTDQFVPANVIYSLNVTDHRRGLCWRQFDSVTDTDLARLKNLWNAEYPEEIGYKSTTDLEKYLSNLAEAEHVVAQAGDELVAWMSTFVRYEKPWFFVIIRREYQGCGLGGRLMHRLMEMYDELYGWAVDVDTYKRSDGKPYPSPLAFYRRLGFRIRHDVRFPGDLSCVRVEWQRT